MKAKYIVLSLIASLAVLVGCQKEGDHFLSEVSVSSSYVAIDMAGGSATISVDASGSWSVSGMPEWLTVSPESGSAGQGTITFSAPGTLDGRTAEVHLSCNGKTQNINVIQGLSTVSPATCAEVIAGPDSKTYRVTGICTKIANTNYGNWYLEDATGEIYIYGTVNSAGNYAWASFGIEVGDEVTVEGPKTTYNGTVELVDVQVIKVNKSLIKVAEMDPEDGTIPTEGGELTVKLTNKGTGVYVEVPEAAQSWLSIASIAGNTVKFRAVENVAGPRDATLVFKTTDGKKEYTAETKVTQLGATGSQALPFTVSEAIEYMTSLGEETAKDFYVKGIVSKVVNEFTAEYGNATFWISEDGVFNDDLTKDFEGFRVLWLDNKEWAEGNAQIAEGAEVVLCGHLTVYKKDDKTTIETAGKKAYVYKVNGVTAEADGIGTEVLPFNVAGAAASIDGGCKSDVFVKGKISAVLYSFSAQYGTATFWISDDGKAYGVSEDKKSTSDPAHDFECYSVYWNDGQPWAEGNPQVEVGDDVVIKGQLTKYGSTYETASKKAWVYSLNGK